MTRIALLWRRAPIVLLLVVVGAACAEDPVTLSPPSASPAEESVFPVTLTAANGDVTIQERPEKIVSLSPTATEMLFAVGAGPQVIAVDDSSNYPPEAPVTSLSGIEPNIEAIAEYQPDLVVASYDPGELQASLDALEIPLLIQPAALTLDDTYEQIEQIGTATGHPAAAEALTASMIEEIESLVADAPVFVLAPTYYHELDQSYFTVTSDTFIGQVYGLFGLTNIADQAKDAASGYPQLSAEYILDADPSIIFLADTKCCAQSAATVADRPGWDRMTAVKGGAVVELDDDVASRWGPRVVEFMREVLGSLLGVEAAA